MVEGDTYCMAFQDDSPWELDEMPPLANFVTVDIIEMPEQKSAQKD